MTTTPASQQWSSSVDAALTWAGGLATLDGDRHAVTLDDLFVGLLLAEPDADGEVWSFLEHFGLKARDVLPDDYPVIDEAALTAAASSAGNATPNSWNDTDRDARAVPLLQTSAT